MASIKKAKVKSTGIEIEVYMHESGKMYIDYSDCKTEWAIHQLIIIGDSEKNFK